jgi:prepilin-type N-terminal cleavage/methylation domain-containing protein
VNLLKNNKGYTLVELVAALLVTAVVFSILFGVFRFTNGLYQKNMSYSTLNYAGIELVQTMEENILNAKGIVAASRNELTVQKANRQIGTYLWDGENLTYNNKKLGFPGMKVTACNFSYYGDAISESVAGSDDFNKLDRNNDGKIDYAEAGSLNRIAVFLEFQSKKDSSKFYYDLKIRGKAIVVAP